MAIKPAIGFLTVGIVLPALLCGADAARCRLSKGLYEDRLALAQKQGQNKGQSAGALLPPGTVSPADKLAAIDEEYRRFLGELAADSDGKDTAAVKACCDEASSDHAGALFCQLSQYLNGGRKESAAFMEQFPGSRKDFGMLWDLNAISAGAGKSFYPPQGPSYKMVDELFLLVMDERDLAITKYFNLATRATGDEAKYMEDQMRIFLKENPAALVNQWLVLRRYRPKLRAAANSLIASSTPAEMQKVVKAVRAFCDKANPDCPDILKLYAGK